MDSVAERLRAYWTSKGIRLRSGVSQPEIATFEARWGVRLPEKFRDYLLTVDGLEEGEWDDEMCEWLALDRLENLAESWECRRGVPNPTHWFAFIDFLISSHCYAINLVPSDPRYGEVVTYWGAAEHSVIARSFGEFLERYLQNPREALFPPGM